MADSVPVSPLHVVIVGGGIAALETVLALHELAGDRVRVTLIAPEPDFVLRPLAVVEPFGRGQVGRLPLAQVMSEHGGTFVRDAVMGVDAVARTVMLAKGDAVAFDLLVLATGASAVPPSSHALTFGTQPSGLNGLVADLEQGWARSAAFVVPAGCTWPLPLYELVLMTAWQVWSGDVDDVDLHLVTPELAPLGLFGEEASTAVAALLRDAKVTLHLGVEAGLERKGHVGMGGGPDLVVDRVVTLPLLEGPDLEGVPSDGDGFVPVDDEGRVRGLDGIYAVGDATDRPIKQGGLACQQADVTAAHIAARAGAQDVVVPPLEQVLRGRLLSGARDRFLERDEGGADPAGHASDEPLWWPPAKVSGRWLAPYLETMGLVRLPAMIGPRGPGIDVDVPVATAVPDVGDGPGSAGGRTGPMALARMAGSSIAGRDAAAWVTDFLNAAYFRRPEAARDVDDLRLASCVLTTYWHNKPYCRRLRLTDLRAFHRAFGHERFSAEDSPRGTLDRGQLLDGAARLLGDWFPAAYADDARRGWGIAFATPAARLAYDPVARLALARLGPLTPERAPGDEQVWHTYPPVEMPSVEGVIGALTAPETWPDFASEIGRFTPLRPGGLDGQTFEVEVAAGIDAGLPVMTRGYVTVTRLVTGDDEDALTAWFAELEDGLARFGDDEPRALPDGAHPIAGLDLTTHQGHFMGHGHNRLLVFELDGRAFVRAAGTWDPMPWSLAQAYRVAGRDAQHAFWGQGEIVRKSMLHQLALHLGATPLTPAER